MWVWREYAPHWCMQNLGGIPHLRHGESHQSLSIPPMSYTVNLIDFPDAPADVIATAETRFRRELDKLLGDNVEQALKAFENASESSADELTKDEIALAASWAKAYEAAKTAGFRALGEADEAYFEVRVE